MPVKKKGRGVSRFQRSNPLGKTSTYICDNCGKRTRETGQSESGVGLCAKCFEEAGLENEHSDYNGHNERGPDGKFDVVSKKFHPKCPTCQHLKAGGFKEIP